MDGPTTALAVFACLLSSAVAGLVAHARLPSGTFTQRAVDVLRVGVGMVAVMAALLLAMTTVNVKRDFDSADRQVRLFAAQLIELDHTLRGIGALGDPARDLLFRYAARTMKDIWPETQPTLGPDDAQAAPLQHRLEDTVAALRTAAPDAAAKATMALATLVHMEWDISAKTGPTLSPWLMAFMVFWLMLTFATLGVSARRSALAIGTLFLCAAALSGAVFLVVEYDIPFEGVIIVSSEPVQNALFAISE
jgi:hypothetical protein